MKINVKGAIIPNDDKWIYEMLEMDATSQKTLLIHFLILMKILTLLSTVVAVMYIVVAKFTHH